MWQIFGAEITRFAILVVASLVMFGLFWLYYDAWRERKILRTLPLLFGLITLSLSFLAQGLSLETQLLTLPWQGIFAELVKSGYLYLRVIAYVFIIIGLWLTPIEDRPKI